MRPPDYYAAVFRDLLRALLFQAQEQGHVTFSDLVQAFVAAELPIFAVLGDHALWELSQTQVLGLLTRETITEPVAAFALSTDIPTIRAMAADYRKDHPHDD